MKLLCLAAIIVVVSSGHLSVTQDKPSEWPWQVGKLYRYDMETNTLARYQESNSTGNSFRAQFIVRVKSPGNLQARLENPEYAQVHQTLEYHETMPENLKYQPVPNLDNPFEIYLEGGRVLSVKLPFSVSLTQENLIKGLVGALQVDLSSYNNVQSSQNNYDSKIQQGLFRKMETDVTGNCETLYSVSPVAAEWRRELPNFASDDQPNEITKSKNYGHCHHRVDYHFGVPDGAEWSGTAHKKGKEQAINRATVSRLLVGKNGPIYKAETTSTVTVNPHLYGEKKAEVHGKVRFNLVSYEQDTEAEWQKPEGARQINNLLYSLTSKPTAIGDSSWFEKHINIKRNSKQKVVSINKKVVSNSHDSSSSSESNSAYVNDDIPQFNEPAYASLYLNPQPHGDKKQNPMNAQKLVQEIAQQLQNPNNIPKADLLSKFNILVRVVSSMSYGQLSQTSRSMEIAKSSNDIVKSSMWMIYRDAVAQSGSLPAFQQIKSWIEIKKLEGEEAAQVIAVLAKSLRHPSKLVMKQFFDLAMNPEVTKQAYLNSSALIAATRFINMGQVNNETAHRYYPTHLYGRQSSQDDSFVVDEVLPRLSQELQRAIENGDSRQSQVYIKAIGILGHPAILDVFAPYLEGENPVSTYLRTRMIEDLNVLASERNSNARAVLYSILKNTAEPYEVRVAAIHNIFMSRPTTAMMMAMAQMTKDDPSIHVRGVLKSAIISASELKNPHFHDLATTARAAKDMLTNEEFGSQYSAKIFNEYYDRDEEPGILSAFSTIGSKNSLFPKYLRYAGISRTGGWNQQSVFSASASNVQQLFNLFADQMFGRRKADQDDKYKHKYSAEQIANLLNIKRKDKESLEASIYVNLMNQYRHFALDENEAQNMGIKLGEYFNNLNNGVENHYTKMVNKNQISIMFPIASGVPFIFKYKEPTLVHVQAKAKGKIEFFERKVYNTAASIDSELRFVYAENHEGNVGFLDTLGNQLASVGLVRKMQFNMPVKMNFEMKSGEVKFKLSPMESEQDSTIAHYSVWPYTANQKRDTLTTISQDHSSILITRPKKVAQIDTKFGQQVGSTFQLQGYSYSEDYKNIGNLLNSFNSISSIITAFKQKDIAQTHFNLRYLGKQSKNKGVSLTAAYDTLYNQNNEGKMPLTANNVQDVTPNSPTRRDELVKRVVAGIKTARAHVVDLSAKFDSPKNLEYVLTFAIGESPVDPKIQYAFYAGRNSDQYGQNQINAAGRLTKPVYISPLNLQNALEKDLMMNFEADILYNGKENVHIQVNAERTNKSVEELQNDPKAKRCLEGYAAENYYQRDCHEVIVKAHAPNSFKFTVTYKDVSPVTKNAAYVLNKFIEGLSFWRSEMNSAKVQPNGKLEFNLDASYGSRTLNLIVNSRFGEWRVNNLPLPEVSSRVVSAYWPFSPLERVLNYYSSHQYQPYCSVDNTQIRTFSNRNYDYSLSRSWHLMVYDERPGRNGDLVVLSRKPNENNLEMYISYRSHTGKHMEIELQPAQLSSAASQQQNGLYSVKVNTNAKKVSQGELTTYWDDVDERPILEYHNLGENVLMLKIRENHLRVLYDGKRSVVLANGNRGNIRGICGAMSGEPRDDYLTPSGLVDKLEYFGAAYVLIEDESDPKAKQWQMEGKRNAYQPQNQYTAIQPSDDKWKQESHDSSEDDYGNQIFYRARNYAQNKEPCKAIPQVQFYENQLQICITTTALPSCQSHCSGEKYKVRAAQVVCQPKSDQQFQSYRDQIKLGHSPKVSGVPQTTQYRVPKACKA